MKYERENKILLNQTLKMRACVLETKRELGGSGKRQAEPLTRELSRKENRKPCYVCVYTMQRVKEIEIAPANTNVWLGGEKRRLSQYPGEFGKAEDPKS